MYSVTLAAEIKIEVPWKRVADLLCSAFEGGSNYWYVIERFKAPVEIVYSEAEHAKIMGRAPQLYKHLDYPISPGGSLIVSDAKANDKPTRHTISRRTLTKGLAIMAKNHPKDFGDFMDQRDDANTGDIFLQCVCFGEVIYG